MQILEGKSVAEKIRVRFIEKLNSSEIKPNIAVLGIKGNNASEVYINTIKKNCANYDIGFNLMLAETEIEFRENFERTKNDENTTGIMFQQPLPEELSNLINKIPPEKDIEGIGIQNTGKLFLGTEDVVVPCTSQAVMETLDYYGVDLEGKKVAVVGRSNIVGKPLALQLLAKDATVTICHSNTQNLKGETSTADVVIIAIGKAKFLKKDYIKEGAILIDVGINFEDGKIVGDVDFEDVKEKASACTPVPGGIGVVTNAVLIDNIIKSCQ